MGRLRTIALFLWRLARPLVLLLWTPVFGALWLAYMVLAVLLSLWIVVCPMPRPRAYLIGRFNRWFRK